MTVFPDIYENLLFVLKVVFRNTEQPAHSGIKRPSTEVAKNL